MSKIEEAKQYAEDLKGALNELGIHPAELETRQTVDDSGTWSVGVATKKDKKAVEPFLKVSAIHDEANAAVETIKEVLGIV